jgi:hypothetical protein
MDQVSSTTQREIRKMPLLAGKKNIGRNIKEMEKNHPQEQAIAAALEKARKSKMTGKNGAKHFRKRATKS